MSTPAEPMDPAEVIAGLRGTLHECEAYDLRVDAFVAFAPNITGPLGELLREIAAQRESWLECAAANCVTEAECIRMEHVVNSALDLFEAWFRGDQ